MGSSTAKATSSKAASSAGAMQGKTPPHPGDVWVNTDSKVYHPAGSRYAGNTKQGQWMSEADAQKYGARKAAN